MNKKIDDLGRIVIPSEMRKELGVKIGNPVKMVFVEDKIIITNPKKDDRIERIIKRLNLVDDDLADFETLDLKNDILSIIKTIKDN